MDAIQSTFAFLAGLVARFGLLLAIPVALAVVIAVGLLVVRSVQALRRKAAGVERVDGLLFKNDLFYAPGHTWLSEASGRLRVGVDDLARRLLPEPRTIELPAVGRALRKGETAAVVVCGDKRIEIAAPVDGAVAAVNDALAREPHLLRDAYARGWFFALTPSDAQYAKLPRGDAARSWTAAEAARLTRVLESDLGIAAADGGEFLLPTPNAIAPAKWDLLVDAFLRRS